MSPVEITNEEFLRALAGDEWGRVPIQSFAAGDNDKWVSHPAKKVIPKLTGETANYFCVSLFRRAGDGRFLRTKELFERQFVFVVDDVGTKVNEGALRLTMPPATYELETSPGNFQFGYKLTDATDARATEALVSRIIGDPEINPSLRDPGMKSVTRVVRVPVGSNVKPAVLEKNGGKGWPHRLWVWEPSRVYTVAELADWLDVDLTPEALSKFKGVGGTRNATTEESEADYVRHFFETRDMVLDATPNAAGFISVRCPWADEHSDGREDAGYRPGLRGFQCHHGHCEGRTMDDLRRWVAENVTPQEQAAALAETFGDFDMSDPLFQAEIKRAEARYEEMRMRTEAKFNATRDSVESDGERDDDRDEGVQTPEYSEDWLALLFAERFGHMLRFVPVWGKWRVYDGRVWRDDEKLSTYDAARKVCRAAANSAETAAEKKRLASAKTRAAVVNIAQSDPRLVATVGQWDQNLMWLNTPGGVVDLETGEMRPHRPDDYLGKITSVAPGGGCPTFLKFLMRITGGDRDFVAYLRRVFGYCLTGLTTEDALFFLHGSGANGKSTLLRVVKTILNDYALSAPSSVFTANKFQSHPTEIARMHGKRLVVSSEIEPNQKWAESRIKELTGGDEVSARLMRQDFFDFVPQMKLLIAGNHKPGLSDVSEAFRRRLYLLPFVVTIPASERDKDLEAKLIAESGGILQWMIEGCAEWQKIGLQPPPVVTLATGEYLESQDRVAQWIETECEKKAGAQKLLISDARKKFNDWATTHNIEPLGRKEFRERIERLGHTVREVSEGFVIQNLVHGGPF
ncbi:MAG: phage/plasmid primase, P4 family [Methylocystis sp.]|uniref:phage/plasmid primase, P4 family n=1 Tax=Methylocystis sp. TaxID=1911079 RepID=UPI003DA68BED